MGMLMQWIKTVPNGWVPVSTNDPMPTSAAPAAVPSTADTQTEGQAFKTNASTAVPVLIAAAASKWTTVVFQGYKAQGSQNTGNVFVGPASADAANVLCVVPGASLTIDAAPGKFIDLNLWYIDVATANDGVGWLGVK